MWPLSPSRLQRQLADLSQAVASLGRDLKDLKASVAQGRTENAAAFRTLSAQETAMSDAVTNLKTAVDQAVDLDNQILAKLSDESAQISTLTQQLQDALAGGADPSTLQGLADELSAANARLQGALPAPAAPAAPTTDTTGTVA